MQWQEGPIWDPQEKIQVTTKWNDKIIIILKKLVHFSNESVKEWIDRWRTAEVECKYKEVDRQLKEQFIHGLNDDEKLVEVIRELRKCGKDVPIPSETVLAWAKRVEAERIKATVISSLHKSRNIDAITYTEHKLREKTNANNTNITRKRCKYCK